MESWKWMLNLKPERPWRPCDEISTLFCRWIWLKTWGASSCVFREAIKDFSTASEKNLAKKHFSPTLVSITRKQDLCSESEYLDNITVNLPLHVGVLSSLGMASFSERIFQSGHKNDPQILMFYLHNESPCINRDLSCLGTDSHVSGLNHFACFWASFWGQKERLICLARMGPSNHPWNEEGEVVSPPLFPQPHRKELGQRLVL